jgi:hypothetical protein
MVLFCGSVVGPDMFPNTDPDPAFYLLDPAFYLNADQDTDPDPAFYLYADQETDRGSGSQTKAGQTFGSHHKLNFYMINILYVGTRSKNIPTKVQKHL